MDNSSHDNDNHAHVVYYGLNGYGITVYYILTNVLFALLGIVTCILNTSVTYIMTCKPHNWDVSYIFITNLAISDAICGIFCIYDVFYNLIHYKDFYECLIRFGLLNSIVLNSSLNLIALTFDRYVKILSPYKYLRICKESSAKWFTGITWTVSIVVGLLPVMGWNIPRGNGYCSYFGVLDKMYLTLYIVILLFGFVILCIMYIHIITITVSKMSRIQPIKNTLASRVVDDHSFRDNGLKLWWKPTKTILFIVGLNTVCFVPIGIYILCVVFGLFKTLDEGEQGTILIYISSSILINSLTNPIIYACQIPLVRRWFRRYLKQITCRLQESEITG